MKLYIKWYKYFGKYLDSCELNISSLSTNTFDLLKIIDKQTSLKFNLTNNCYKNIFAVFYLEKLS